MSESDSHYFYVLNQAEFDLKIDHDFILQADPSQIGRLMERWFERRSNVTGNRREPSEEFKAGVYRIKEDVRKLEES